MTRVVLVSGAVPGFADHGMDDYRGAKRDAAVSGVAEMGQRHQAGTGTQRVTAWRVASVMRCQARCPWAYSLEVDLFTTLGIPGGKTGLSCGSSGPADGAGGPS